MHRDGDSADFEHLSFSMPQSGQSYVYRPVITVPAVAYEEEVAMSMRRLIGLLLIALTISGCGPQPQQKPQVSSGEPQKTAMTDDCTAMPVRHFDNEQQAVRLARKTKGVYDAVAVQIDDKLNVGLDVRNFSRLRLKPIRKETFDRLEQAFPDVELHVTTDRKVVNELKKMSEKPWQNEKKAACAEKRRLDELEQMMKG